MSTDTTSPPRCPMHRLDLPEPGPPRPTVLATGTPVWLVTRYAEVRQVLMDPRFDRGSLHAPDAPPQLTVPNLLPGTDGMVNMDGEPHRRLRSTEQRAFTPRAMSHWRTWVASVDDAILGAFA